VDDARLAASLIAVAPILFVAAGFVTPQGLYQEPDHAARLLIIENERGRFLIAQALWVAWLGVPLVGWILLSRQLVTTVSWPPTVAVLALGLGTVLGIGFVVLQTADPLRFWLNGEATWVSSAAAWLVVVASALFGVALLSAGAPPIPGYVLAAYALIGAVALVMSAPAFFVVAGFSLAAVVPAVALWQALPPT